MRPGSIPILVLAVTLVSAVLAIGLLLTLLNTPHTQGSIYSLVIFVNGSLYSVVKAKGTVSYLTINSSSGEVMVIRCINLSIGSLGIANASVCMPYLVNASYSLTSILPPESTFSLQGIGLYVWRTESSLVAPLFFKLPVLRGIWARSIWATWNYTPGYMRFYINATPLRRSSGFVELGSVSYKWFYAPPLNITPPSNIVALWTRPMNITLLSKSPSSNVLYLYITIGKMELVPIIITPKLTSEPYKLTVNIAVNGKPYINYSYVIYSVISPVLIYSTQFWSVKRLCLSGLNMTPLNIYYNATVCLPLSITVKMPGYFWFSSTPSKILMPEADALTSLVLRIIGSLPIVRDYVNGSMVDVESVGFQAPWIRLSGQVPSYTTAAPPSFKWILGVYDDGARVGIIYVSISAGSDPSSEVSIYTVGQGPSYAASYIINIDVELMPSSEVRMLNGIKLEGISWASKNNTKWGGYVVSYDSGLSPYGNDTFEAVTGWVTIPQLAPGISCPSGSTFGLSAWVGLSPGNQWSVPYIQAGWLWIPPQYNYTLFYADEPQNFEVMPVDISPYSVGPYSSVQVNLFYNETLANEQNWYINWYVGYPNGTLVEYTSAIGIGAQLNNWQAAQFIAETPQYLGSLLCAPAITGGNLTFYTDYVYDTVTPTTQLAPNGTWIGLSQFPSGTLSGQTYIYRIVLESIDGYLIEPTQIGECTVPQGYYNPGYVSENCFTLNEAQG